MEAKSIGLFRPEKFNFVKLDLRWRSRRISSFRYLRKFLRPGRISSSEGFLKVSFDDCSESSWSQDSAELSGRFERISVELIRQSRSQWNKFQKGFRKYSKIVEIRLEDIVSMD